MQRKSLTNNLNNESESAWVRKHVWEDGTTEQSDDMGTTILGDNIHPTPVVIPPQQSQNLSPLATIAIATLLPMMGLGGLGVGALATYLLTKPTTIQPSDQTNQPNFKDSTVSIGLGRLENSKDQEQ